MSDPFDTLDDALAFIDSKVIHTGQGSFIKVEDLKDAVKQAYESRVTERVEAPRPKTMAQAKRMAKSDEGLMALFPDRNPLPPGKSVPAMDPTPVSRP